MVDVNISLRGTESFDGVSQSLLLWDTLWNPDAQCLDWVLAGNSDPNNLLGLQATRALDTAILIQLATHKRAPSHVTLPAGTDPRGWWGDSVDLEDYETEIGSWLWLLYRSVLNDAVAKDAVYYAQDCLQPLINQGAVARFDVSYVIDKVKGLLGLQIDGYSKDGQHIYSQKFMKLWQQEFSSLSSPKNSPAYYGSML